MDEILFREGVIMEQIIGFCSDSCPENGYFCVTEEYEACSYCGHEIKKRRVRCGRDSDGYAVCSYKVCSHYQIDCLPMDLFVRDSLNEIMVRRRSL